MDIEAEAYRKNDSIAEFLKKKGKDMHVESIFTKCLIEKFAVLIVDADLKGILYNFRKPMSLKPGNLFVDVKGAVKAATEIFAGYQKPDKLLSSIQLLLVLTLALKEVVNVELPEKSAEIIVMLNRMGAYDKPVEETVLLQKVLEYEREHHLGLVKEEGFMKTMDFLDMYKIVEIVDGKVRLAERVFGKDFA
ncbi:hypothetical protein NXH76_26300 [Blautia schinkii]|nr:hypothetical protein [Blautia schinkii]